MSKSDAQLYSITGSGSQLSYNVSIQLNHLQRRIFPGLLRLIHRQSGDADMDLPVSEPDAHLAGNFSIAAATSWLTHPQ